MTVDCTRGVREAEFTEIFKLLIPEASLSRGHNPREHVLKAYKKERQGTIRELDLDGTGRREVESLDEIFHGTLPMVETLGEKTIDCKLGKLDCRGEKGDDGADFTTETWLNEKAPFGVVRYSYQKRRRGMSFTLEDAGAGAESKLPDAN